MSVRVRDLRRSYGAHRALEIASLDIAASSLVLVTGANGAGKSTFLRCVAGIGRYDGTVDRPPGVVAYLPQGDVLPSAATVREVLALFGTPAAIAEEWVRVDARRRIGRLSGGERRRVAIAAVMSLGAPLVALDEPYADLDASAADALTGRIAALRSAGATILVAAPDREVGRIARAADQVIRLEAGRIAAEMGTSAA